MDLQARWSDLCLRLGCGDAAVATALHVCVEALYSFPPRHYHTLGHVEGCLSLLDRHRALASDPDAVEAAIFLHDCVYLAGREDNEQRSALIAEMMLRRLGAAQDRVERVHGMILATRHADRPDGGDEALIQDIDLAGLASEPASFDRDGAGIRREFAAFSDEEFRRGRREFLRKMLAREVIYHTQPFFATYEQRARANLERALRELND